MAGKTWMDRVAGGLRGFAGADYVNAYNNQKQAQMAMQQWQQEQLTQAPLRQAQADYYTAQSGWLKTMQQYMMSGNDVYVDQQGNPVTADTPNATKIKGISKSGVTFENASKDLMDNYKSFQATAKSIGLWDSMFNPAAKALKTQAMEQMLKLGSQMGVNKIPQYDKVTQRLQQNVKTGEYRVVPR